MSSTTVFTVNNPKTGEVLSTHQSTPHDSFPSIFKAARAAQKTWQSYSFKQRASYVLRMKKFIRENKEEIIQVISDCSGKTKTDALCTEVMPAVMAIDWYTANAQKVLQEHKIPTSSLIFANKSSRATYVPFGVVGIVSPWNYPFSIPFGEIVMALMAGNAIVLKVANSSIPVGEMIARIVASAQLPEGLFHHVVVSGTDISKLFFKPHNETERVDKLFFTGSVPVGKQLMREASDTLTPLSLELGGNDAAIVTEDACLEKAAQGCVWAGFQNAGCSCGGVERIYVHESVYDKFLALVVKYTEALTYGNTDLEPEAQIGALATKKQCETVDSHVKDALEKGAKIAAQAKPIGDLKAGYFYPPTVLVNVTNEMLTLKEETFGPIIPIIPYKNIDDAIRMANDSDLGLTASVWCNSSKRHKIARLLEAGVVSINDHLYSHGRSELPWRGFKNSGVGSTHGAEGLREMCQLRIIDDDILPFGRRSSWYYPHGTETYKKMLEVLNFINPSNIFSKFYSLLKVTPFVFRMFSSWKPKQDASANPQA